MKLCTSLAHVYCCRDMSEDEMRKSFCFSLNDSGVGRNLKILKVVSFFSHKLIFRKLTNLNIKSQSEGGVGGGKEG